VSGDESSERQDATFDRSLRIRNRRGLHARAAAKFVKLAAEFRCDIRVGRSGQTVSGHSIMGLMMLAAGAGTEIDVSARGEDAEAAMEAIASLVANKFGEAK